MVLHQLIASSIEHSVRNVYESLGTVYTNDIAMQLAKSLRKPPMIIAELIKTEIQQQGNMNGLLHKIEVVAPGFINLYIHWQEWAGCSFALPQASGGKVVVEHTSINPNKAAHIGHLRNSCIGDTLVRILRKTGHNVEVHNYIDDLGNQLADTMVGLFNIPIAEEHIRFGDYCWDVYAKVNKAYVQNPQMTHLRTAILQAMEEGRGNEAWFGNLVAERIVREHVAEMKDFGIEYDLLVWESTIVKEGFWASAFELLKQTSIFVRETAGNLEGCWVLKQTSGETGVEESDAHNMDKVLVRSNGILTYTAKDIAYHLWKYGLLDRDFLYNEFSAGLSTTALSGQRLPYGKADTVINVIDYRQEYPQQMVKQALQALGYTGQADKLLHVSYGVVSLSPASAAELGIDISDGKTSYAMSGRQGIGVKITDLVTLMEHRIEQTRSDKNGLSSQMLATAAIRYYLLRFNLGTEVVFDFQQATEISGNTGVYLMYSYARASSVLNRAGTMGFTPPYPFQIPAEPEKAECALLRQLSSWQDALFAASRELTPHSICNYAYTVAALFNNFYSKCPILKSEEDTLRYRLALTLKFKDTLKEALDVLGMPAPDRM